MSSNISNDHKQTKQERNTWLSNIVAEISFFFVFLLFFGLLM